MCLPVHRPLVNTPINTEKPNQHFILHPLSVRNRFSSVRSFYFSCFLVHTRPSQTLFLSLHLHPEVHAAVTLSLPYVKAVKIRPALESARISLGVSLPLYPSLVVYSPGSWSSCIIKAGFSRWILSSTPHLQNSTAAHMACRRRRRRRRKRRVMEGWQERNAEMQDRKISSSAVVGRCYFPVISIRTWC